ncbi:hypothetical protein DDQ50_00915 [Amnibacterium flavum]|uniref:Signal transduction histidine kinase subgroup 3 dimerisation and phosphoacceptor domain-containing protein n=1 Tax=Amnibacterium flavum TaxID=2173173 RepID=A0A2V1HR78_9MICO|nr:hypothetical protein DDQ50_00915 [Amnibacterium flavum]
MTAQVADPRVPADVIRTGIRTRLSGGIMRLPARVDHLLELAGGKWAFAWSSYAFLFFPAVFAVAALEAPTGFTTLGSIGVGAIGVGSALIVGIVFNYTLLRHRTTRRVHVLVLVFYWVTFGVALGLSRALSVMAWTDADPDLVLRLVGSICGAVVWVPAAAIVQAMLDIRRQRLEELEANKRRLERIRDSAETSLEEQTAALSAAVRTAVQPHIDRLSERVAAINSSLTRNVLKNLAGEIKGVSDDVVRLTSHQVVEPGSIEMQRSMRRPRIFNNIVLEVLMRPITWPWVGSFMIILGTGPEIFRTSGLGTVLLGTGAILAATVVLTLVEHFSAPMSNRRAALFQWGLLVLIAAGVGLVPPLVEGIGPNFKVDTQLTPIFLFVPLVALGTLMTSIAVATRRQTLGLMNELELMNQELEAVAHGAHLQADDVRRRVAALLHGPVQGRLSAASMLLGLHLSRQSNRTTAEVIEETAELIRAATADLAELATVRTERHSVDDVLSSLRTDWSGIVEIDWTYDPVASMFLEADAALGATVSELVVDMITNAARHGRARHARLSVHAKPESGGPGSAKRLVLEVRCENDGSFAPAAPSEGGLVGALLRTMGGTWTVTGENGAVLSLATIPLRTNVRSANIAPTAELVH